jgi:hypothetical protein
MQHKFQVYVLGSEDPLENPKYILERNFLAKTEYAYLHCIDIEIVKIYRVVGCRFILECGCNLTGLQGCCVYLISDTEAVTSAIKRYSCDTVMVLLFSEKYIRFRYLIGGRMSFFTKMVCFPMVPERLVVLFLFVLNSLLFKLKKKLALSLFIKRMLVFHGFHQALVEKNRVVEVVVISDFVELLFRGVGIDELYDVKLRYVQNTYIKRESSSP